MTTGWLVDRRVGPADVLHELDPGLDRRRTVRLLDVDAPAVVLGSTQPVTDVDQEAAAALGVVVVSRRSGGGAVLLDPGAVVWLDVVVPRGDPLWDDDVVRSMIAMGQRLADALGAVGVDDLAVHRDALARTALARVVCFGAAGPGEVTRAGRKLVGLSQRRTRDRARFQVAVPRTWDGPRTARLLAPGLAAAGADLAALDDLVAVAPDLVGDDLVAALTR